MANNIRDIIEWYPFIPPEINNNDAGNFNSLLKLANNILDLKIRITFLASDKIYGMAVNGTDAFDRAELRSIVNRVANIRCYGEIFDNGYRDIEASVLVGRDVSGMPETSYIIMLEYDEFQGSVDIQPACLMFMQEAPKLKFYGRLPVDTTEANTGWSFVGSFNNLNFTQYFNSEVSWVNNTLTWTGQASAGSGVWVYPPYKGMVAYIKHGPIGLRSINGQQSITIQGDEYFKVEAMKRCEYFNTSDTTIDADDIIITITPVL